VRADSYYNNPFGVGHTVFVSLLIAKMAHGNCPDGVDLFILSTSDEDGLSTPLDCDGFTKLNRTEIEIGSRQGGSGSRNTQGGNALDNKQSSSRCVGKSDSRKHHVSECTSFRFLHLVDTIVVESSVDASKLMEFWDTAGDGNIARTAGESTKRAYIREINSSRGQGTCEKFPFHAFRLSCFMFSTSKKNRKPLIDNWQRSSCIFL